MAEPIELPIENDGAGKVELQPIETEMETSYLDYAMSVIVSRALPDVRDGLKPIHRRILYAMNNMGLRHTAKYRKSATVVGEVMGNFHPHGDAAIYESLARMAQSWSLRYMLIDGQGNFGSPDGDHPAAMRYTEAKMTAISNELLADIDKDTVDFMPNFDGRQQEPKVLPAKLPNLLINGQMGIAVGMATNIPPHNLREVVDAIVYIIDHPEATVDDLMGIVLGPDFPTGGVIFADDSIRQAYGTGKGGIVMRAVAEIETGKKDDERIVITELPYQVSPAGLQEKIAELVQTKRVVGIGDVRNESDKSGLRVVIELKRDAYPKKILNQLYKLTPMQTPFHVNMLALVDGIQPRVLNLEMILRYYLDHRKIVVRRRTEFELRRARERAHILEGLKTALDHIDEVISIIRGSATKEIAAVNLTQKYGLSEAQTKAILEMRLQTLAGLERQKIEEELAELVKLIARLEEILSAEANILKVIREELVALRDEYGDDRRTKIISGSVGKLSDEELVPNEQVIITLTKGGYIKRIPANTYKAQGRGGRGIVGMTTKEEDVVEHLVLTYNHDFIMFFTNRGRIFRLKGYEIPAALRTAKGQFTGNLLSLGPDEKVTAIVPLGKDSVGGKYLFMATTRGTVKKTSLADYENVRSTGMVAIKLDAGDELRWVQMTSGENEILISTSLAQAIRFKEADVRPMGRVTHGVRGMRLRTGDRVVGMDVVASDGQLLVVMENGYGKRTKVDQFPLHNRGGVGTKAGIVTSKTGQVIDVRAIQSLEDDLVVISSQGVVIRQAIKAIPVISRVTQGVRVMKLGDKDKVASVALVGETKLEESIQDDGGQTAIDDETA